MLCFRYDWYFSNCGFAISVLDAPEFKKYPSKYLWLAVVSVVVIMDVFCAFLLDNMCYHHLSFRLSLSLCNMDGYTCRVFQVFHNLYIVHKFRCQHRMLYSFLWFSQYVK